MFPKKTLSLIVIVAIAVIFLLIFNLGASQAASTIFFEDFDDGYSGWKQDPANRGLDTANQPFNYTIGNNC